MSNIERAFSIWTDTLNDIWSVVFQSCADWNPDVWQFVKDVNAELTMLSSSLIIMFFFFGLTKQGISLRELRQPEVAISCLLRLALSSALVTSSLTIMIYIFQIIQGTMSLIAGQGNYGYSSSVPEEIKTAIDDTSLFSFDGIMTGLIGFLLIIVIYIMAIILLVIVWGRFIYLYIHCAVSGCFFACFASEPTQHMAVSFMKSFANAAFQGVIVVLALMVYSALISSDSTAAIQAANDGDSFGAILLYAKDFLVGGLVTLTVCKAGDQIGQRMGL